MKKSLIAVLCLVTACEWDAVAEGPDLQYQHVNVPGSSCHYDLEAATELLQDGDAVPTMFWCDDVDIQIYVSAGSVCKHDSVVLKSAVEFWEKRLSRDISIVQDEQWGQPAYGKIYLTPHAAPVGYDGWAINHWGTSGTILYSNIDLTVCTLAVLKHELGHALGFDHSEHENTVMHPHNYVDEAEILPTELAAILNVIAAGTGVNQQ